jgi:uncharacterized protein (TIGR00304 family)
VRLLRFFGPGIVLLGLLLLALAVQRGEARLYLVIVVPVVAGTGPVAFLAILLVFVGFFLTFLLWPAHLQSRAAPPAETVQTPTESVPATRRWGGVVFLGPIPLVFGSDPRMTRTMLLVGMILFFALLALTVFALLR